MFWLNFSPAEKQCLKLGNSSSSFWSSNFLYTPGTAANNVALEFFITFGISEMVKLSSNTIDVAPMLQGSSKPVPSVYVQFNAPA